MKTTIIISALLIIISLICYIYNRRKPKSIYTNDYDRDYYVILGWIHDAKRVDSLYNYRIMIERFETKHTYESNLSERAKKLRDEWASKADELLEPILKRMTHLN